MTGQQLIVFCPTGEKLEAESERGRVSDVQSDQNVSRSDSVILADGCAKVEIGGKNNLIKF